MFVEVVRYFAGGHEDGVNEFLIMRVSLLGACEDFAEVVDWSLDAVCLPFFRALDDEYGVDNAAPSGDVEVQWFLFLGDCEDWRSREDSLEICECIPRFFCPLELATFPE